MKKRILCIIVIFLIFQLLLSNIVIGECPEGATTWERPTYELMKEMTGIRLKLSNGETLLSKHINISTEVNKAMRDLNLIIAIDTSNRSIKYNKDRSKRISAENYLIDTMIIHKNVK